jgi:hypothetical protein
MLLPRPMHVLLRQGGVICPVIRLQTSNTDEQMTDATATGYSGAAGAPWEVL